MKITTDLAGLPAALAAARKAAGIPQQDLAAAAGMTPTSLSRIEKGVSVPRLGTLLAMVEHMPVEVSIEITTTPDNT